MSSERKEEPNSTRTVPEGGHKLEGTALKDALKKQIEYYFSKENLITDAYLVSQMNTEMFVPVSTIANFKAVKTLTGNIDIVVQAISESPHLNLDPTKTMVRPVTKVHRSTILLREVPTPTQPQEIKDLFQSLGIQKVVDVKSDIADSWYVSFEDEETTLKALEAIRGKTFKDQPIRARIKTESSLKTLLPIAIPQPVFVPPHFVDYSQRANAEAPQHRGKGWEGEQQGRYKKGYKRREYNNKGPGRRDGSKGGSNPKEGNKEGRKKKGVAGKSNPVFQLENPGQFPPLPSSGYANDFKHYSREEIVTTFRDMKEFPKPENLPDCKIILQNPDLQLENKEPLGQPAEVLKKPQTPPTNPPKQGVWSNFSKKAE